MSRIPAISLESASGKAHDLLTAVKGQLGSVPNIFKTMAQSPTVLEAYLNFNATLGHGSLPNTLGEQIAVTVAGSNQCDYCASAHTALGKIAGVASDELQRNLSGHSNDAKTQAALNFCLEIINKRGGIDDASLNAVRSAGYNDAEILEMIAHIAINTFTNYFNRVAETEIDFRSVSTANVT